MNIGIISSHSEDSIRRNFTFLYDIISYLSYTNNAILIGYDANKEITRLSRIYKQVNSSADLAEDKINLLLEIIRYRLDQTHCHLLISEEPRLVTPLAGIIPSLLITHEPVRKCTSLCTADGRTISTHFGSDEEVTTSVGESIIANHRDIGLMKIQKEPIQVYAVNLRYRQERRAHIIKQFEGRREFNLNILNAVEDSLPTYGLWKSLCKAVRLARDQALPYFVFCEDDHIFTSHYNEQYLRENIDGALSQEADLLCGGIGGTDLAVPVSRNRFCLGTFYCTQFVVIFQRFYDAIIRYKFEDDDTADGVLSVIAKAKMTVYPFLSRQRSFGYSDVTANNNIYDIENYFNLAETYLERIRNASIHYNYPWAT